MLIERFHLGKAYQVNVTDPKHVEDSITEIVKEFNGRLDIFIANAGIPWQQGAMLDGEISHYRKVVTTDLDSTFYCARAAGAHWRRQKKEGTDLNGKKLENFTYGSFVATASMSGQIVNIPQLQAAYNAAKAGVIHLCKRNLSREPESYGTDLKCSRPIIGRRVGSVCTCKLHLPRLHGYRDLRLRSPGDEEPMERQDPYGVCCSLNAVWSLTDSGPSREGEAHELKGAYLYLSSDAASYCTGTDIRVDGGYCLP